MDAHSPQRNLVGFRRNYRTAGHRSEATRRRSMLFPKHMLIANVERVPMVFALICMITGHPLCGQDRATGALPVAQDKFRRLSKAEGIPGAAVREPRVSMRFRFPEPRDQGSQFSCTGFAVAYALKTYLDAVQIGLTTFTDDRVFSPAFIYNQFSNDHGTSGIYIEQALAFLQGGGCCPWNRMPYDPTDANTKPTKEMLEEARKYRIASWDPVAVREVQKMKSYLIAQIPVVIGASVDVKDNGTWKQNEKGVTDEYLHPDDIAYHAMVVTGYDDDKGAFEIMNSWGPNWNDSGFGWVAYGFWPRWVSEGYIALNAKNVALAPAAAVKAQDVKWLPVGPEGTVNGNWGFPWNVNLKALKPTKEKTLPVEVKQYLARSFETNGTK
jgi:hypothetical protein